MDDSDKGRYDMILGRAILTALGINLKFYERVIEPDDGPLKGSSAPMVDIGTYGFKHLNTGKLHPKSCL